MANKPNPYGNRWQTARRSFLMQNPLCVMCQQQNKITPATVVDHITPHRIRHAKTAEEMRQAQVLFWNSNNWQALCETHHNATKQRIEKSGKMVGSDENGIPLDPNSHWFK